MPLSNSQYDEIFRKYDEKQLASQHQLERRTKDVYARIPALKEIIHRRRKLQQCREPEKL